VQRWQEFAARQRRLGHLVTVLRSVWPLPSSTWSPCGPRRLRSVGFPRPASQVSDQRLGPESFLCRLDGSRSNSRPVSRLGLKSHWCSEKMQQPSLRCTKTTNPRGRDPAGHANHRFKRRRPGERAPQASQHTRYRQRPARRQLSLNHDFTQSVASLEHTDSSGGRQDQRMEASVTKVSAPTPSTDFAQIVPFWYYLCCAW
jgi:hypothetical protein